MKNYKLTATDIESFIKDTAEEITARVVPEAERTGNDIEPIKLIVAGHTIEIPLNAGTYNALIEAVNNCFESENE